MRVAVVTLFPELFEKFLETSFVGRATASGALSVHLEHLRQHGFGKHRSVDDTPYGGGSGMVMRVDATLAGIEAAEAALGSARSYRVLLTPQGERFRQPLAGELVRHESLLLVCGRYEGFDDRIHHFVDREVSLGDFVLSGGEVAAMALLEACVRLLPGVLGNEASSAEESFSPEWGLLEYPQYTRPVVFRDHSVPEILRSGDHGRIAAWRREQSLERTRSRRPDLIDEPARETLHGRDDDD
jgi:tRNA (guanine37-N1)-methyltransferase